VNTGKTSEQGIVYGKQALDGITVRDFADKYGIDYVMVYNITYRCRPLTKSLKNRLYSESELVRALTEHAENRVERLRADLGRAEKTLDKIRRATKTGSTAVNRK